VTIRYKQTVLGVAWAILQPLLSTVISPSSWGAWARGAVGRHPLSVFVYLGLPPLDLLRWRRHPRRREPGGQRQPLSKVYFPRLLSAVATLAALVDTVFALACCSASWALWTGARVGGTLSPLGWSPWRPPAPGSGSGLERRYRDVQHAVPFLVQLWMSPAGGLPGEQSPSASASLLPNPRAGLVEANAPSPWRPVTARLAISTAFAFALFAGALRFPRMEKSFADGI